MGDGEIKGPWSLSAPLESSSGCSGSSGRSRLGAKNRPKNFAMEANAVKCVQGALFKAFEKYFFNIINKTIKTVKGVN